MLEPLIQKVCRRCAISWWGLYWQVPQSCTHCGSPLNLGPGNEGLKELWARAFQELKEGDRKTVECLIRETTP